MKSWVWPRQPRTACASQTFEQVLSHAELVIVRGYSKETA
jgi:hypothetical protein